MAERADVELLESLLASEHDLLSAYDSAIGRKAIDPELGGMLRDHEFAHVRALLDSLPEGAARNPRATVRSPELVAALRDPESFARFALELEDRVVGEYADTLPRIRDAELRRPLGSIMACGSAHAVALRDSLGRPLVN
jgi:Ferritin-like domain